MKHVSPLTTDFKSLLKGNTKKIDEWNNSIPIFESQRIVYIENSKIDKLYRQKKFAKGDIISKGITGEDCKKKYKQIRQKKNSDIAILVNSNYSCAYCGTTIAKTVDHFLPEDTYGQLALCLENMVPCCDNCNRKKSKYIATKDLELLFNPNYNTFVSLDWIILESISKKKVITFRSSFNDLDTNLSEKQKIKIKNTLFNLDILKSFDAALDKIYQEDYLTIDIKDFISNNDILSKEKEHVYKLIENSDSLSERNFLKYRLLCHFETQEFKNNFIKKCNYTEG